MARFLTAFAFLTLTRTLPIVAGLLVIGLVVTLCWNVIALPFGLPVLSLVQGFAGYLFLLLVSTLFVRRKL